MRVHDNAFYALMRADDILSTATFEGTVTNRPNRYASVFPRDVHTTRRVTGPQDSVTNEYVVHSVGTTPDQAKLVRERVLLAVLNKIPTVSGWNSRRVQFITSQPLNIDRDVIPPLYYCVDVYAFDSEPV